MDLLGLQVDKWKNSQLGLSASTSLYLVYDFYDSGFACCVGRCSALRMRQPSTLLRRAIIGSVRRASKLVMGRCRYFKSVSVFRYTGRYFSKSVRYLLLVFKISRYCRYFTLRQSALILTFCFRDSRRSFSEDRPTYPRSRRWHKLAIRCPFKRRLTCVRGWE